MSDVSTRIGRLWKDIGYMTSLALFEALVPLESETLE